MTYRSWTSQLTADGGVARRFLDGNQEQETYSPPQQNAPQQSYKPRLINPSQVTMAGAPQRDTPYTKPDMSRYSPGRAQPIQPQSQGTQYGQPQQPDRFPYGGPKAPTVPPQPQRIPYGRPQTPQQPTATGAPYNGGFMSRYADGTSPQTMAAYPDVVAPYTQPGVSGFGPGSPQTSPFSAVAYGFDGTPMEPAQFSNQRDALIQLLNDDNARYQMQSGIGQRPGAAPQSPDIASLWSQAGDMVNDGWRNPLTGGTPMGRMNSNFAGQPRSPQMQGMASQGWMF